MTAASPDRSDHIDSSSGPETTPKAVDDETLIHLTLLWEESWEHGVDRSPEQLVGDRTELIEPLRQRIDLLKKTAWMNEPLGSSSTGDGAPPAADQVNGLESLPDRYQVRRLLGLGGHGAVFEAFDQELKRVVAIKTAILADARVDLIEEARRVAGLRHPSIVRVFDVLRIDSRSLIVSEFIEGETLADVIARGPLRLKRAVDIAATIADALDFAHRQTIVHRDVKPSNILLDRDGRPHLADFGIAARSGVADPLFSGTLRYASPEQVRDDTPVVDGRSDIYSLGVVLFEMLTGRSPYPARTAAALREQVLFQTLRQPTFDNARVPDESARILQTCLAKLPVDRFRTAADLASQLRSSQSSPVEVMTRRRVLSWSAAAAGGAVAAAAGFAVGRIRQSSDRGDDTQNRPPSLHSDDGSLSFDGRTRILTDVFRTVPVTLEAWIRPDFYIGNNDQWVIGSDVPSHYGLSLGLAGSQLVAEYRGGIVHSPAAVPPNRWSHVAATFEAEKTTLFLNGRLVATGPGSTFERDTRFVIGNVGETNLICFYRGDLRSLRISSGIRFESPFVPDKLSRDETTLLLIDESSRESADLVIDETGEPLGRIEIF